MSQPLHMIVLRRRKSDGRASRPSGALDAAGAGGAARRGGEGIVTEVGIEYY